MKEFYMAKLLLLCIAAAIVTLLFSSTAFSASEPDPETTSTICLDDNLVYIAVDEPTKQQLEKTRKSSKSLFKTKAILSKNLFRYIVNDSEIVRAKGLTGRGVKMALVPYTDPPRTTLAKTAGDTIIALNTPVYPVIAVVMNKATGD